ncbi:phosphonoacetate hydrolase [Actinokineospora alba]|uniref:Phosphonoacetate hydrolase n=1 Tax=Actinokineospora alba TaxID=504798 RepID=A0A1H0W2E4_9PSEU|nr:phosphonoacetate hydrolase [Actinokineospora alba]TDP67780.1 phosphonoacetate hydrolase [Actinokineospora alba]SDI71732.1 phosphonoacetate hydrolase [Actinokineospora alba]SDP84695.1 phosphonoacetate hydrolase [Actinokineospora alba]
MSFPNSIEVNGRDYRAPVAPVVVVCIDGSEPDYHEQAIAHGRMPYLERLIASGSALTGDCAMPSFTNPNNLSIATGQPPAVHGISGNFFFDPERGEEVMMNEPRFLRVPTIFAKFAELGSSVAIITAKDKLRRLLGSGLEPSEKAICFSSEKADQVTVAEHGIENVLERVGKPLASVYSADLSEFVLAAGVAVLQDQRPDLVYLSLTDYVQHKYAPGTPEADDFYAMMDGYFAQIDVMGAVLVITADHGMNAKSDSEGKAGVVFLQELLDERLGKDVSRVILPITDPYTVHHGALGSFACVHLPVDADHAAIAAEIAATDGVQEVHLKTAAAELFELPEDRIGDLIVIGDRNVALGTTPDRHDLSQLDRPLRSHGGLTEQKVPFLVNRPVTIPEGHRLRNFDAYWVGLNLTGTR